MTKSAWINIALDIAENSGLLNLLQKTGRGTEQHLYILTYHRVEDPDRCPWLDPNDISTTPHQFESQMKLVADRYHPVSAEEVLAAAHGGPPLPTDAVLVTVDDGYHDFQDVIFPICRRNGILPLLFQPTAYVGTGTFWWDKVYQIIHLSGEKEIDTPIGHFPLPSQAEKFRVQHQLIQAFKKMPFDQVTTWVDSAHASHVQLSEKERHDTLTWDELRQLNRAGVTIASHSHTHPMMTQIPLEEARQQILISQSILQRELGYAFPIFAFPDGKPRAYSSDLINMLYAEGFEMLFLLVDGRAMIRPGAGKFALPRLTVWQNQTLSQFHLRLTPWWFRSRSLYNR